MDNYRRPRTAHAMQLKGNDIVSAFLDWVWSMRILQHSFRKVGKRQDKKELSEGFKQVIGSLIVVCEPLPAATLTNLLPIRQEAVDLRLRHLHSSMLSRSGSDFCLISAS